jgi:hypothetical protein
VRLAAISVLALALMAAPAYAAPSEKLSFWSGPGAHAGWQGDKADSPSDDNIQDIEFDTTATGGYAGLSVRLEEGTPTSAYGPSSFDVKSDYIGASLGSPRLVVFFSDGGYAELRPLENNTSWQTVEDPNWDNHGVPCDFGYEETWAQVVSCHPNTTVTRVIMVADPYGHTHWIDNLHTAGNTWDSAQGNGN